MRFLLNQYEYSHCIRWQEELHKRTRTQMKQELKLDLSGKEVREQWQNWWVI